MSLVDHEYNAAAAPPESGVCDDDPFAARKARRQTVDPVRTMGIVAVGLSIILAVFLFFNPQSSSAAQRRPGIAEQTESADGQPLISVKVVVVAFFVS
jgi:hypothetical protein